MKQAEVSKSPAVSRIAELKFSHCPKNTETTVPGNSCIIRPRSPVIYKQKANSNKKNLSFSVKKLKIKITKNRSVIYNL